MSNSSVTAPTWQSECTYYESLVQQGGALGTWAQQNLDVMAPTLRALGIDTSDIIDTPPAKQKSATIKDYSPPPAKADANPVVSKAVYSSSDIKDTGTIHADSIKTPDIKSKTTDSSGSAVDGYATQWNTVRFSNTTAAPLTIHFTVGTGQQMPPGVDSNGDITIQPGQFVDLTFAPGTSVNFKSTTGDGSVWNQGEIYFDGSSKTSWFDMSYIYGANSNMRIYSSDGEEAGYQGDILANAPAGAKVGDWGIQAPYEPDAGYQDIGGPDGDNDAGGTYLYNILPKGDGYVGRGKPAETTTYDDASSLQTQGQLAVVF